MYTYTCIGIKRYGTQQDTEQKVQVDKGSAQRRSGMLVPVSHISQTHYLCHGEVSVQCISMQT